MDLSGNEMLNIENEGFRAVCEYLASCTVTITSETVGFQHGSGVAVRYGDQHYILTAAHVLEQEPDNEKIMVIARPDTPLKEMDKNELKGSVLTGSNGPFAYSSAIHIRITHRLVNNDGVDIAALKIEDAESSLPHTVFHDL